MVINVRQNQDNIVNLSVETSVTNPYFLITFTNCFTQASFSALFEEIAGETSYYTINIEEVGKDGTIDYVNGKVKLSPAGSWELVVYAQTSSTNLEPSLADENLGSYELIVAIPDICVVYPPSPGDSFCDKMEACDAFIAVHEKADVIVTDGYGDKYLNDQGVYVTVSGGGGGSGTVTSVSAGTGMNFSTITTSGAVAIDTTKVPYYASGFSSGLARYNGSAWAFDTNTYITGNQTITISGDASGSGSTSITLTLPDINSNVGTFNNVTVNAKGQVTAASNVSYLTSVTGTANRITVTGSTIDIASTYVGQSSITTIGTITTGVWNAGALTTSGDLTMSSAKGIKDANGNYVIVLPSTVASAVNYFTVSNSATGGDVNIAATGSDTNVNILYSTKGTGVHRFNAAIHLFNGTNYVEALRAAGTTLNFGAGFSAISFSVTTTFAGISSSAGATLTGGNLLTGTTGNMYMNNGTSGGTGLGQRVIHMYNGTAPSPSVTTDRHQYYSDDQTAGNAAPHFRTENGDIIKIYAIGGWGTPTGTLTRTTFATYAGGTASGTYTSSELQAVMDAVKINSERLAALISDLKTGHQLLKA